MLKHNSAKNSSIMIKLVCLILFKCRKLRLNLVKSKLNLFEE
jgi:hypothetical protein